MVTSTLTAKAMKMNTQITIFKKLLLTECLVVLFILTASTLFAQQHPSLDNYLFTPVAVSPAHAGMQDQHVVSIVDAQWVGLKGAPRTGKISMDYLTLKQI